MEPPAVAMQWIDDSDSISHNLLSTANNVDRPQTNSAAIDNSLTSLNWLPEFKIPSLADEKDGVKEKSSASIVTSSDSASSTGSVAQEAEIEKDECFLPLSPIKRCLNQTAEFEKDPLRYEENPNKPPFSYTTIIYLAIRSCSKDKVMLSDIYQWIKEHFKYYRIAESTWQNSVRHNLSLNQFFRKIPRGEGDPGKGSFWQINPEYEQLLNDDHELQRLVQQQNGMKTPLQRKRGAKNRKKANSCNSITADSDSTKRYTKPGKRSSSNTVRSPTGLDPCHLPGDLDWVTLLSSQKVAGCISCTDAHHCRPTFGSPVLGTPDLGHIGDPVLCSPAVLPSTLHTKISDTPPSSTKPISLEDIITTQESPAPLLPPWAADSRSFSPTHFNVEHIHPWAEAHDCQDLPSTQLSGRRAGHWSPTEVMWGCTTNPTQINKSNKLQIAQLI